jgi:hypothetical protein
MRDLRLTLAPCFARANAVAAPIPLSLDEPVTIAVLPARYCSEAILIVLVMCCPVIVLLKILSDGDV